MVEMDWPEFHFNINVGLEFGPIYYYFLNSKFAILQ